MFRKRDVDPMTPREGAPARDEAFLMPPAEPAKAPGDGRPAAVAASGATPAMPGGEGAGSAASGARPPAVQAAGNKRLIVGQGIRLSGEISSCDRLVVEGEVEVTLNDTLALEIAPSGKFTGGCEVEEADISGVYDGDLTVRKRLVVRGSGRLNGTIRYGQLELERGGQIAGTVSVLSGPEGERRSRPEPATASLSYGDQRLVHGVG